MAARWGDTARRAIMADRPDKHSDISNTDGRLPVRAAPGDQLPHTRPILKIGSGHECPPARVRRKCVWQHTAARVLKEFRFTVRDGSLEPFESRVAVAGLRVNESDNARAHPALGMATFGILRQFTQRIR